MTIGQIIGVALAVGISTLTGLMLVQLFAGVRRRPDALTLCFATSIGLAVHSVAYLFWATLLRMTPGGWALADAAVLALVALLWWRWTRRDQPTASVRPSRDWPAAAALIALASSLWMAGAAVGWLIAREPLGQWDAWAMWNFKARMLYFAPDHLLAAFASPFPHPDYPLLLPLTIARLWRYSGQAGPTVAQGIAMAATLLTAVTLAAGVARLRGLLVGCLGGVVLLSSLFFIRHGASQYADTLVALHMLMALIAASLWIEDDAAPPRGGSLILVGVLAGCAAWTKNEGVTFAAFLLLGVTGCMIVRYRRAALRRLVGLAGGIAGFVALLAIVRFGFAERGTDLLMGQELAGLLQRAGDAERYGQIFRGVRAVLTSTVDLPVIGLMFAAGALAAWGRPWREFRSAALAAAVLGLQFITYLAIYLLTAQNLAWHLQTSADRVMIQLWPGLVLLLCLLLPRPSRVVTANH